jgi:hypothetical protein
MMMMIMMMIEMMMIVMMIEMIEMTTLMIEIIVMMMHTPCDLCRPVRDLRGRAVASQRSGPPVVLPSRLLSVPQLVSSRTQAVSVALPREQTPLVF